MTLAFHILANTGFGTAYSFTNILDPPEPAFTMTYANASNVIRENMLVAVAIPHRLLSLPFVPKRWAKVGRALKEIRSYMTRLLDNEQSSFTQGAPGSGNLLSSLVRGSEDAWKLTELGTKHSTTDVPSTGLTRMDVLGNIYIFGLAGHETTGNSLAFAIYLLAAHPEVQAWATEEVDYVHTDHVDELIPGYDLFPRFKRCLAILVSFVIPTSYLAASSKMFAK